MPYFTRRPYAEMQPACPAAQGASAVDILALADEVLAAETKSASDGPFRMRTPVAPGAAGRIVLDVAIDPGPPVPPLRLITSDLVGSAGRIAADRVRVDPATLVAGQDRELLITVSVPSGAAAGTYSGTVTAPGPDGFVIPIEVQVSG